MLQTAVMAGIGRAFGLSHLQSVRAGLLLAAGGEFAFVTFQGRRRTGLFAPASCPSSGFLLVKLQVTLHSATKRLAFLLPATYSPT